MKKLHFEFYPTDEEAESDQNRQLEDAYIQDMIFGRIHTRVGLTKEEIEEEEFFAENLMNSQDNQMWVNGWGYLNKSEITLFKRIHGLLKLFVNLKIRFYDDKKGEEPECPF